MYLHMYHAGYFTYARYVHTYIHMYSYDVHEEPWKPVLGEVISMDFIENAKAYHSHFGVNSFEKGTHAG